VSADGSAIVFARGRDACELFALDLATRQSKRLAGLVACPDSLAMDGSGISIGREGVWHDLTPDGIEGSVGRVATRGDEEVVREGSGLEWHGGNRVTRLPADLSGVRFLPGSEAVVAIRTSGSGASLVKFTGGDETSVIAGPYAAIDSYAISPDGVDVALSASRNGNFDVGIVSSDGGDVRWVFPDRRDERLVTWAPRGSKIAYVIEDLGGSIIRTVHVPTSATLNVALPWTRIDRVIWTPDGDRLVVADSSLEFSSRIEMMRYGGEERETIVAPEDQLRLTFDLVPGQGAEAIALSPLEPRYGKKAPGVIRTVDGRAAGWDDVQAAILRLSGAGMIVVGARVANLGDAFWNRVSDLAWLDSSRIFILPDGSSPRGLPSGVTLAPGGTSAGAGGSGAWVVRALRSEASSR